MHGFHECDIGQHCLLMQRHRIRQHGYRAHGPLAELVRGAVAGIGHVVEVLALDSDAVTTIVQAGSGVSPSQVD
ncbi:MAG: hypothetical protein ACFNV9_07785, partial [Corynebacterium matruchotii]